jgi:outer membrane protein OmpA-like peptidoglycan-associated protein
MTIARFITPTINQAMKTARTASCIAIGALLLASCSTPPQPPSVDESTKRPVNTRAAVELKACQGDLSRASLRVTELTTELTNAGVATAALNKALQQPVAIKASEATVKPTDPPPAAATADLTGNLVAVVPFSLGSAAWSVDPAHAAALVRHAKDATLIMIRGRTDATTESLQETALARRRAEAAAEFLQQAGVSKDKLRLTWQGAGDPLAGLRAAERAQSRRVEIEFYAAAPVLVSLRSSTANGKVTTAASL